MPPRTTLPANGNWKQVHLSRSEVLELVFGKINLIEQECESASEKEHREGGFTLKDLTDAQRCLKRIAIEARRAASIIETHAHVAQAGHCIHCGKTYEEHDTDEKRRETRELLPKKLANPDVDHVRCIALRRLFESVELETYQPLQMVEA